MLKWVKKQVDARQRIYGKKENRTPEEINFLNNTKPWIKLASSVRIKDSTKLAKAGLSQYGQGRNLAKNFVLFNGVSINAGDGLGEGFRSGIGLGNDVAYGIGGKDFGYKPMPGIESVSVSTKGNYGGLKEATIKIFAYNKQQFDIIELLYLRLGYSVLLEFGHSQYVDNNNQVRQMGPTMTDTTWFDNAFFEIPAETISSINGTQRLAGRYQTTSDTLNDLPFDFGQGDKLGAKAQDLRNLASKRANAAVQKNIMEAQKLLLDIKKRYVGNYEGMIGKISNFSWDLNSNGVYQITLKVITYGDLVDGFFVNTKKVFPKDGEIGKGLVANIVGTVVNFFSGLFGGDDEPDPPEIPDIDRKFLKNAKDVTDINGVLYMFYDGLYNSGGTGYENRKNIGGGNPWKFYTENINADDQEGFGGSSPADIFDIKTIGSADDEKGEGYTDDKYISLGYYLDILNKFTMGFIEEGTEDITGFEPNADSENGPIQFDNSQDTFFCNTSFYQISGDPTICLIKNTGAPASIITDDQYRDFKVRKNGILVGDIMNIYLQMNYLAELCYNAAKNKDSKITVKDHIETILNAVSESLGGLNRLKVKCDENTGKLYIFDENPLPGRGLITDFINPGANNPEPVEFLVYGFEGDRGSFVRDFGIKSRIDNSLSTMITIGKNRTGITPGYDATPFANWNEGLEDTVMPSLIVASQNSNDLASYKEEYKEKLVSLANLANKLYKNDEKVKLKYTSQTKNVLREVVMAEQAVHAAENKQNGGSSPLAGFLPISLELTIDGLSGMKVFQTYTVPNSFLPAAYPKAFDFILKKYSHEVNKDGWTTKFESFSIPSSQEKPLDAPWYQISAGILASIIAEAEQEKNDAEFAAQTDLFDSRSSVRGGVSALGAGAGAGALGLGAGVGQEINADNLTLAKTASPGSIQRVKNLVAKFESRGNYGIFNYGVSGGNGASTDGLKAYSAGGISNITTQTFEWINTRFQRQTGRGQAFATGKYQIIPNTMQSFLSRNPDFKSKLFNVENQEVLGDYLFTKKRTSAGNYLLGKNAGTQKDLSDAIQDIGYEFASMPVIKLSNGTIVGDVVTGTGKGAYYGGQGPNPSTSKVSVATMAIALIGSRIDYTGQQPQFIPSYYT